MLLARYGINHLHVFLNDSMLYSLSSTGDSYKWTNGVVRFKVYDMSRKTVAVNEFLKTFRQYCHPHSFFVVNGFMKEDNWKCFSRLRSCEVQEMPLKRRLIQQ